MIIALNLDGTMQGAGGVGGLLAVVREDGAYIPTYDANGNISEYLSASDGSVAAHYDYSPFGEQLVASGPLAASFTHRFSTKPYCQTTGFCEYQMRKYNPNLERWMSRDPIEEQAKNENSGYCFCCNSSIRFFDKCGLISRQEVEDVLFFHPVQSSILKDEFLPEDLKALGLAKARIEYRCRCSSNVLLFEIHFFPLIVYRHGEFSDYSRQITVFQHEYNHTVVYKNILGPTLATMFLSEYAGQKCCNCENRLENAIAKFKELEKGISIWDINTEYYTRGRGHMQPNIDYGQSRGVLKKTVQKVLSSGVVPCEN